MLRLSGFGKARVWGAGCPACSQKPTAQNADQGNCRESGADLLLKGLTADLFDQQLLGGETGGHGRKTISKN